MHTDQELNNNDNNDVITQMCLKPNSTETPRTRQYFYSGPATTRDLDGIKTMYAEMCHGRPASISLIVRRSLALLASHLRGIQGDDEKYQELAALMQHSKN